ncbi:MAG: translocation/assembly module TamB domain-containing protein [Spirochaetes bacterium]|nr:translocation/assembly module TamB domain-containing protein [Spirochaetota bacterium]
MFFGAAILFVYLVLPLVVERSLRMGDRLGSALGMELDWNVLLLSWFRGELRVRGVRARAGQFDLDARELRLSFDWGRLLATRSPIAALQGGELIEPLVTLHPDASPGTGRALPDSGTLGSSIAPGKSLLLMASEAKVRGLGFDLDLPVVALTLTGLEGHRLRAGLRMAAEGGDVSLQGTLEGEGGGFEGEADFRTGASRAERVKFTGRLEPQAFRFMAEAMDGGSGLLYERRGPGQPDHFRYYHDSRRVDEILRWMGREKAVTDDRMAWILSRTGIRLGEGETVSRVHIEKDGDRFWARATLKRKDGGERLGFVAESRDPAMLQWNLDWSGSGYLAARGTREKDHWEARFDLREMRLGELPASVSAQVRGAGPLTLLTLLPADPSAPPILTARIEEVADALLMSIPSAQGLEASARWSKKEGRLSSLSAKFGHFALRPFSDILGVAFLREVALDGSVLWGAGNELKVDLGARHTVTARDRGGLKLRWTPTRLLLDEWRLADGGVLRGDADLSGQGGQARFQLERGGKIQRFEGTAGSRGDQTVLRLRGVDRGGEANLVFGGAQGPSVSLKAWPLGPARLSGEAALRTGFSSTAALRVTGSARLEQFSPWDPATRLETEFSAGPLGAELTHLHLFDDENHLWGMGQLGWVERLTYRVSLGGVKDQVSLEGQGEFSGGDHRGRLVAHNLDHASWKTPLRRFVRGKARILADLSGPVADPNVLFRMVLDDVPLERETHRITTEIEKWGAAWTLRRLDIERILPNGNRKLVAHALKGLLDPNRVEAALELDDFPLLWSTSGLATFWLDRTERRGFLQVGGLVLDGKPQREWLTEWSSPGGIIRLKAPSGDGVEGTVRREGRKGLLDALKGSEAASNWRIDVSLKQGRETAARLDGRFSTNELDLALGTSRLRASYLRWLFLLTEEEIPGGELFNIDLAGRHFEKVNGAVHVGGTPSRPILTGRALFSGKLRFMGAGDRTERARIPVEIADNIFTIRRAEAAWADGSMAFGDGTVTARALNGVEAFDLKFTTRGPGVPGNWDGSRFTVRAKVGGEIALTGSSFYPRLRGVVRLSDGVLSVENRGGKSEDWALRQRRFFNRIEWDVGLEAGARMKLESALFDLTAEAGSAARFAGTLYNDEWSLAGSVTAKSGTYTHQGSDFRIKNLTLNFPKGEGSFNPYVDLEASTRAREAGNVTVEIILSKKGRLLDDNARFTSSPGRTPDEIKTLMGWLDPREKTAGASVSTATGSRAVANTILFRPLERSLRRALGLDYVRIDTDLLAMAQNARGGGSNLTTTLSFGKYLTESLFLQSDFNFAMGSSNSLGGALNLEYDLGAFNLGTRFEIRDFNRMRLGPNLMDLSIRLDKNWSF